MSPTDLFSRTLTFPSVAGSLKWKFSTYKDNLTLLTEQKELIAKFVISRWSFSKTGKIVIIDPNIQGPLLDEIIISGMAMMGAQARRE